ncbi:MAG: HDOD domain-containing protein [Acidobacteriota bacterium]
MNKRLLFVDDDPNLLMGLQRGLRSMRDQWDMEFVDNGEAALAAQDAKPFDVIVSDMRMPGMSGFDLLNTVQDRHPQTIRILLTGQADRHSVLRSVSTAHQYVSKPCDAHQLRDLLSKTMALSDLLENSAIKTFVSRLSCLPSLPSLYLELTNELRANDPSPGRIGEIISRDMAMTAKILQVANSAAHGIRNEVTQPEQAVLLLGLDTVQALVLSLSIFRSIGPGLDSTFSAEDLWHSSKISGVLCRAIANAEGIRPSEVGAYLSAGLLHEIGKLMIAAADSRLHGQIVERSAAEGRPETEIEQALLGCTHAEIGAYLLGIWGLPISIVEAVAWHHHPGQSPTAEFSPLAAVHVANVLQSRSSHGGCVGNAVDSGFLERIGKSERLPVWERACSAILEQVSER